VTALSLKLRKSEKRIKKEQLIARLISLLREYPNVLFAELGRMPADHMQRIRRELSPDTKLMVIKKRLVPIAFSQMGERGKLLEPLLDRMPGRLVVVATRRKPWEIAIKLREMEAFTDIRPGEVAEEDVVIPSGPTQLMAGPALTDLRAMGIPCKIVGGKISITEDYVILKKGERASKQVADVLRLLGVNPVRVYLRVTGAVDSDGIAYDPEVLYLSDEDVQRWMAEAVSSAISLGVEVGDANERTIRPMLSRAFSRARALALEAGWIDEKIVQDLVRKAVVSARALKDAAGL